MDRIQSPERRPNSVVRAVSRWKLTEPVRLYVYGVGSILIVGLVLAGWATQEWAAYLTAVLGVLLGGVPATEAARSSVYSLAGHLHSIRQLRSVADIQAALETPLFDQESAA